MSPRMPRFSLDEQPEVFFTTTSSSRAIRGLLDEGRARKLGPRLYTKNLSDDLEVVTRRNWSRIAAGYFRGAVVVDRTALEGGPASDGSVTLATTTKNEQRIPGLRLRPRLGHGPVEGDVRWMGEELYFSSPARAFLENMRSSRARGGLPRTLSAAELEERLDQHALLRPSALNELRDEARALAHKLDAEEEFERLDALIGALSGTRPGALHSTRGRARRAGVPFDPLRIERFGGLQGYLQQVAAPSVAANQVHELSTFAFFEAYFSNFIEGTEFTLEEAERIVFEHVVPRQRPQDAHDILGTYRVVSDVEQRQRVPADADELIDVLLSQHAMMLSERPDVGPGQFKLEPNRAGSTYFVEPQLVEGTLREGFRCYDSLPAGFHRAVFAMFLVSEVHPFADGNGRIARILMNSELTAAGKQRILVPIASRYDYLNAVRAMTHNSNASSYVRVMAGLQSRSAEGDFANRAAAELWLHRQGAFRDPAEEQGIDARMLDAAQTTETA
ncbi:MAG: Fic family protein [Thermoleophilaceae bacterium]